jgi:EAL domain-containing protein (putative c-di-GMP-specific phosphodiesterase class I)
MIAAPHMTQGSVAAAAPASARRARPIATRLMIVLAPAIFAINLLASAVAAPEAVPLAILASIAVSLCVLAAVRRMLLSPLGSLAQAMMHAADGRRIDPAIASGELGGMVDSFNAMQDRLAHGEAALRGLEAELARRARADAPPGPLERVSVLADHAMRRARTNADRGAIDEADAAAIEADVAARAIEADLRESLRHGWMRIAIQPIIDIATLRPVGGEVLARLCHPRRGEIPPSVFIPVAQQTGQMAAVGEFVMTEALRALPELRRQCEGDGFYLAVNLAATQLSEQLPDSLAAMLDCAGTAAGDLVLEITEATILGNDPGHDEVIGRLKKLGFRFALDDFGTGPSPMSHVDRLRIDVLKIDRAFVQLDPDDRDRATVHQRALLKAMVTLGRELGIPIVAEGIESEQQLLNARALGIGLGQGYLFSQPLPPAAMVRWLASFRNSDVERSIRQAGRRVAAR